jgi:hypothetical protein
VTFEGGFADTERSAIAATKVVATLASTIKQLQKGATEGNIPMMRKASERLIVVLESTRQEVTNARSAWPFSIDAEETYLRESYAAEIVEIAKAEGLPVQQRDEGLVAFPSIIRVLPSERVVMIDRKKVQAVRPSKLVKALKAIQLRKPKVGPEVFLEVVHRAYRLLAGNDYGKTVTLASIYDALTLLPGSTTTYDHTDFARDLFLLDRSGVTHTKSGCVFRFRLVPGPKEARGLIRLWHRTGKTSLITEFNSWREWRDCVHRARKMAAVYGTGVSGWLCA